MNSIKERYSIIPQMEHYDRFTVDYEPYSMFFNKKNFKSEVVNTDELGFRLNYFNNKKFSLEQLTNFDDISIVIGGSTVFGFGSTNDKNTISSLLSKIKNKVFINFGATAFNSKQEIILFMKYFTKFKKIDKVIIVSGVNDLYLNISSRYDESNFFFKKNYLLANNLYSIRNNYKKKLLYYLYKIKNDKFINPNNLYFSDLFKKKNKEEKNNTINHDLINSNYNQIFGVWSALSLKYNFSVDYFFQPLAGWLNKKPNKIEEQLFTLLDNSKDQSHKILNKISNKNNHDIFNEILKRNSNIHSINYHNLNDEIGNFISDEDHIFVDRVHLTNHGYEIISKIISNKIY